MYIFGGAWSLLAYFDEVKRRIQVFVYCFFRKFLTKVKGDNIVCFDMHGQLIDYVYVSQTEGRERQYLKCRMSYGADMQT